MDAFDRLPVGPERSSYIAVIAGLVGTLIFAATFILLLVLVGESVTFIGLFGIPLAATIATVSVLVPFLKRQERERTLKWQDGSQEAREAERQRQLDEMRRENSNIPNVPRKR